MSTDHPSLLLLKDKIRFTIPQASVHKTSAIKRLNNDLPYTVGPGSPTSPFLARWSGDPRAAAPSKPVSSSLGSNAAKRDTRYWSCPASNGRRNGPGLKLKNAGGAVLSGPSCAAAPFRSSGPSPFHLPVSRRFSSTPRAVTVSPGVNVQCPARWT